MKPWDRVQIARLQERPTTLDYIPYIFDSFIELHGDRNYRDDPAMIGGIGYLNGQAVTVVGQQRGKDTKITFIVILEWLIQRDIVKLFV